MSDLRRQVVPAVWLASALSLGCAKQVNLAISLSVNGCTDMLPNAPKTPASAVGDYRFIVTVNGVAQPPVDVLATADATKLPLLPFDEPLRVDVLGLQTSTSTTALAVGSTGDFTIPSATSPSTVSVNIALQMVDTFQGAPALGAAAGAAPACATLTKPRAYHAQALLTDGRVLIYGGVQFPSAAPVDWSVWFGLPAGEIPGAAYLGDSEIFDPSTGTFTESGTYSNPNSPNARAFGTLLASSAATGAAALIGGETTADGGALVGAANGARFSPEDGGTWLSAGYEVAHGHGCAAFDNTGQAMIAGGLTNLGVMSPIGESLDMTVWIPNRETSTPGAVQEARADQACSGFEGILGATVGTLVEEAGGFTTGTGGASSQLLGDLYFYQYNANCDGGVGCFAPLQTGSTVIDLALKAGPRTRAKAAPLTVTDNTTGNATDAVLVTGGFTCDVPSDGGSGSPCTPTFFDGGTAGQLGKPIATYFPESMAATELLAFPITENAAGTETANPTMFAGPLLPSPSVDHCMVSMGDAGVLILGGLGPLSDGGFGTLGTSVYSVSPPQTLNVAGVTNPTLQPVTSPLRQARAGMACTLLHDGSVLVTGGYQTVGPLTGNGSQQKVEMLNTVEVYRPIPISVTAPLGP